MKSEITYKLSREDFEKAIESTLVQLTVKAKTSRYHDRLVSVHTVAEIHGVHRDTVVRYAKAGLLPYEMKGKLYKFRLTSALEFDFHELRKQS